MEHISWFPIFPPGSVAGAVTTSVWVGVWVGCFMNLRFGWVLSGLVVPGYIVPLLILKPWAASVIFVEAILTYIVIWAWSEYLPRFGIGSGLFGRDRFFAIFCASIVVRITLETFFLPPLGEYLAATWIPGFDYRNNLHSFGLVVVSLFANQFWKPGLRKGLFQSSITILVSYLFVRYGLMEFTNYNIGNLNYIYMDVAKSMLASPKSYIILLTTAFIASRMNLDYGWEFGGILIPSLLALQWYQPEKIIWSFVESFLILGFSSLLLRIPVFKNANIEGGRKILFFFNVGFIYHLTLAHLIVAYFPEQKVTDYFGFGYLLTTLLAIRMYDKDIMARVTLATLQTSLLAVLVATTIGFSLKQIPNLFNLRALSSVEIPTDLVKPIKNDLLDVMGKQKTAIYRSLIPGSYKSPLPEQNDIFSQALDYLSEYLKTRQTLALINSAKLLYLINFNMDLLPEGYLLISEREPRHGWGTFVIDPATKSDLLIEIPAPVEEWGVTDAGVSLFTGLRARALAIAGTARESSPDGSSDTLANQSTMFGVFHKVIGLKGILQVRGYPEEHRGIKKKDVEESKDYSPKSSQPTLWVRKETPEDLSLQSLKHIIGPFQIEWGAPPFLNTLRNVTPSGFAELLLDRMTLLRIITNPDQKHFQVHQEKRNQSIVGYLQDWILEQKEEFPKIGSNLYVKANLEDLIYFDRQVLTPFLKVFTESYDDQGWTNQGIQSLNALSYLAASVGYEFIRYKDKNSGQDYVILTERKDLPKRKYWGTYVFRMAHSGSYVIQIPRPITELNVFEVGVNLFEQLKARVLLIGGSHPMANVDGSSDIIRIENKVNLFNLVNQAIVRESLDHPMLVIQFRAFVYRPDNPPTDLDKILSLKSGLTTTETMDPLMGPLMTILKKDRNAVGFADGSPSVLGYEVGGITQSLYLDQSRNKEFVVVWISPTTRKYFQQQTENRIQEQQFEALDIPTIQADLFETIHNDKQCLTESRLPSELVSTIADYMETGDVVSLNRLLIQFGGYRYERLIDISSKQSFILVSSKEGCLVAVANLLPLNTSTGLDVNAGTVTRDVVEEFVNSRSAWLRLQ